MDKSGYCLLLCVHSQQTGLPNPILKCAMFQNEYNISQDVVKAFFKQVLLKTPSLLTNECAASHHLPEKMGRKPVDIELIASKLWPHSQSQIVKEQNNTKKGRNS